MKTRLVLFAAAVLLWAPLAKSADLSRISRKIVKEPAYQTKTPKYCLLVLGLEAKTRVWLVQDGDTLYVDRNGNGDLTEEDERVALKQEDKRFRWFEAGDIHDGPLSHTGLRVMQMLASPEWVGDPKEFERIKGQNPEPWVWTVHVAAERSADDTRPLPKQLKYVANGDGLGMLLFANRPQDAPIIHFNGPWTLGLQDVKQRLVAGEKATLQIGVGTPGVGPGTFTFLLYPDTIPTGVYPVADIAFPAKSSDEQSIKGRYTLMDRC